MSYEYLENLRLAIRHLHKCDSDHLESVHVKEIYRGRTIFDGMVEVFAVTHPRAQYCYAWGYKDDDGKDHFAVILGSTMVKNALDAVKMFVLAKSKPRPDEQ